jgi:hypothetical protein
MFTFNNFSTTIGQNVTKQLDAHLLIIEATIPRAWQEVQWFGRSQLDEQAKQTIYLFHR